MAIALYGGANVFNLVVVAWSILAAAFAPLITLLALGFSLNERETIIVVLTGVFTTLIWRSLGLSSVLVEVGPGLASGFLSFGLCQLIKKQSLFKKESLDIAS